ncbi:hypothetical protein OOK29_09670 [Streptomyces phaeochromogenes]|uniref:hypothetical protein n=1 Tax=Streptomyces phaeochromogenes TaxID=1923 RepID=UPI00224FABD5|nr:hypothetical protein [Streptomyces phaeochromogenes]MCX5598405.1 hypothetical protein [Streptomyces phaeochromogenes]
MGRILRPGWYASTVVVTMPADVARELADPELATYHRNGTATRTFLGGLQALVQEPVPAADFARRLAVGVVPALEVLPFSVDRFEFALADVPFRAGR